MKSHKLNIDCDDTVKKILKSFSGDFKTTYYQEDEDRGATTDLGLFSRDNHHNHDGLMGTHKKKNK